MLHSSAGCSRSCLCNSEKLFGRRSLLVRAHQLQKTKELPSCLQSTEHKALPCIPGTPASQGAGHPAASPQALPQPPKRTKTPPLPPGGEQGNSLKLGFLSSGPQPSCNGWKPRDAIGQWASGGGYRPCSIQPLHKGRRTSSPHPHQALEEEWAAFFPEQFWQLHRFPGNMSDCPGHLEPALGWSAKGLSQALPYFCWLLPANAECSKEVA